MYKSLFFLITVSIISCQGPQDAAEVLAEVEKEKEKTSTETATAEKQQDKIIEFSGGSLAVPPGSSVTAEVTESTALILDLSGVAFASAADSAVKVSGVTESETGVKMSLAIPDENLTLTASSPLAGVVRVDLSTRKIEVLSLAELTHRTGFVDFTAKKDGIYQAFSMDVPEQKTEATDFSPLIKIKDDGAVDEEYLSEQLSTAGGGGFGRILSLLRR